MQYYIRIFTQLIDSSEDMIERKSSSHTSLKVKTANVKLSSQASLA